LNRDESVDFQWPEHFDRVPSDPWTRKGIESLALNYDTVENHGWYSNLDETVEQVGEYVRKGDVLVDYSGGTGILAKRLLDRLGSKEAGIVIVDSSPKFLRLALEKFRDEPRMAFRRIRFLKDEKRLERVDEVLGPALLERGVDAVLSTNAIHLYFDLAETLRAWRSVLRPTGRVFIQSGNIRNPELPDDEWIIDETVEVIHRRAMEIVGSDDAFSQYRSALEDSDHMSAHDTLRRKYFLPVRPLEHYLEALRAEGFELTSVRHRRIPARVSEWFEFLSVYHEGVLGWVGGAEKVTGEPTPEEVVRDRLVLMERAMEEVFGGAFEFGASWTYITCEPKG
jgi:ubiquinone/menaquinone biosynthesis C-methylase UbiE